MPFGQSVDINFIIGRRSLSSNFMPNFLMKMYLLSIGGGLLYCVPKLAARLKGHKAVDGYNYLIVQFDFRLAMI